MPPQKLGDELADLKSRVLKIRSAAVQPIISGVQKESHPLQSAQNQDDQQEVKRVGHLINQAHPQGQPVPPQLPPGILGLLSNIPQTQPQLHSQPKLPVATVSPNGLITHVAPVPPVAIPLQQPPDLINMFSGRLNGSGILPVASATTSNLGDPLQNEPDLSSPNQPVDQHIPRDHEGRLPAERRVNDKH
jgi:hypothetical protein